MVRDQDQRTALVLLLLDGLERRGLTPMREYEVHQLVRDLQRSVGQPFRFHDAPISYSYELNEHLRRLEKGHYLDEVILVRDGWVPRFEYELSGVGRAEALDTRERFRLIVPEILDDIERKLDEFCLSYRPPEPISPR